jgi:hypothetical protein
MRRVFREDFVTIVVRYCPLSLPVRSSAQLQKFSLVYSLFLSVESLIGHIQTGSDEMAEAEKRFELYGIPPFLRPSAARSHRPGQTDAHHLEPLLVLSATFAVLLLAVLMAPKTIFLSLKEARISCSRLANACVRFQRGI